MAAMLVSALVIVGYTILGGFRAVTTTDLIQSVVMSIALVAVLAYGIGVAGGWGAVMENAHSLSGYLTMTASHDAAAGTAASYSLLDIVSTMAWGLGYFGMPHILLRFMGISDAKKIKISRRIGSIWVVISMTVAGTIGGTPSGTATPITTVPSAIAAIDLLKAAGCQHVKCLFLVAAPEGLRALEAAHPDIEVYVAAIDQRLDENAYILPGLGDAGDRLFGTK